MPLAGGAPLAEEETSSARRKRAPASSPVLPGGRAAAVLQSWIAARKGPVPAFDPTDTARAREALALALRYAESVRRGETGVI